MNAIEELAARERLEQRRETFLERSVFLFRRSTMDGSYQMLDHHLEEQLREATDLFDGAELVEMVRKLAEIHEGMTEILDEYLEDPDTDSLSERFREPTKADSDRGGRE